MMSKAEVNWNVATRKEQKERDGHFFIQTIRNVLPLALAVVLFGITATGCASMKGWGRDRHPTPPPTAGSSLPLDESVEEKLRFGERNPIALIIVVDQNGNVQPYRNKTTKEEFPLKFPLRAEEIEWMYSTTVFKTKNPKYCWLTTLGNNECISW
jgi:predicted small secreted protein